MRLPRGADAGRSVRGGARDRRFRPRSGLDGLWLAERHFARPRRPTDPRGAGIPSIASVPLVLAAAIAGRTKRVRIGTGVSVLPLCHPVRTAEEAATVDQVSRGRLDFGVGRSGFPSAYAGYGTPYGESRERFQESLDVILKAWTQDPSARGQILHVQRPDRGAPALPEAAPADLGGRHDAGHVSLGRPHRPGARHRAAWLRRPGGHRQLTRIGRRGGRRAIPASGMSICASPSYVAETADRARSEPEDSTVRSYRRLGENFAASVGATGTTGPKERAQRAERLSQVTYEELLRDRVAYGTPDMVVERLLEWRRSSGSPGWSSSRTSAGTSARPRAQVDPALRRGGGAPAPLMMTLPPLETAVLPPGIRSRFVDDINGLASISWRPGSSRRAGRWSCCCTAFRRSPIPGARSCRRWPRPGITSSRPICAAMAAPPAGAPITTTICGRSGC